MQQKYAAHMLSTLGRFCVCALLTMCFFGIGETLGQEMLYAAGVELYAEQSWKLVRVARGASLEPFHDAGVFVARLPHAARIDDRTSLVQRLPSPLDQAPHLAALHAILGVEGKLARDVRVADQRVRSLKVTALK